MLALSISLLDFSLLINSSLEEDKSETYVLPLPIMFHKLFHLCVLTEKWHFYRAVPSLQKAPQDTQVLYYKAAFQLVNRQAVISCHKGLVHPRYKNLYFSILNFIRFLSFHFSKLSKVPLCTAIHSSQSPQFGMRNTSLRMTSGLLRGCAVLPSRLLIKA